MKALPWASWNKKQGSIPGRYWVQRTGHTGSGGFARIRVSVLGFEKVYSRADSRIKGGALDWKKSGLAEKIRTPLLFSWLFWKICARRKFSQWRKVPAKCFQSGNLRTSEDQEEWPTFRPEEKKSAYTKTMTQFLFWSISSFFTAFFYKTTEKKYEYWVRSNSEYQFCQIFFPIFSIITIPLRELRICTKMASRAKGDWKFHFNQGRRPSPANWIFIQWRKSSLRAKASKCPGLGSLDGLEAKLGGKAAQILASAGPTLLIVSLSFSSDCFFKSFFCLSAMEPTQRNRKRVLVEKAPPQWALISPPPTTPAQSKTLCFVYIW